MSGHGNYLTCEKGVWSWWMTIDHKRLGILYIISIMSFFVVGGLLALAVRTELLAPGPTIVSADEYNVLFTMHGVIMVFLFIVPGVPATLGNFLLPLMIGAKDVAFPKLNRLSFWIYVAGSAVALLLAYWQIDTGWTFYAPYSTQNSIGVIIAATAAFVLGFSSILTGMNFLVTIHKMRAPGMTWDRLPLFVWTLYATALIQVVATPIIGLTLLLLILENAFGVGIFNPEFGGDPVLFEHMFWFYSHPVVYIMILPAFGIVSEIIPVFSRRPIFGYKALVWASVAIAAVSFLVWGHHMFVAGMSDTARVVFSFLTFFVAVPTAVKVFNWVSTLYKGSISFETPMLYSLGFIFLFLIAGCTGIHLATLATDAHYHDTYFVVAHFHYTMQGGTVIALFAGLHFWWPLMFGRMYNEKVAKLGWAALFIGFNGTFLPQFVLGMQGMPRRYYDYPAEFESLHFLSTIFAYLNGLAYLLIMCNLIGSLNGVKMTGTDKLTELKPKTIHGWLLYPLLIAVVVPSKWIGAVTCRILGILFPGRPADLNPHKSLSLEWTVDMPPVHDNFEKIPVVEDWTYGYGKPALQE